MRNLFKKKDTVQLNWNEIESISDLEKAIENSFERTSVLFKHSTRCSISFMALNRLNSSNELTEIGAGFYYLDLLEYRDVSDHISSLLGIRHESPQIIVLDKGKVTYHTSHGRIQGKSLGEAIARID